ncbi:MAG TPA: toprim domain-containing protein [Acidiphilium sp.]|nr:MAG: hypothetical protein B7Z57_09795 [Acidiphilium sp. 37-60-79]HQT74937.1 toprim domain-containing protein [Acidiphilium sp.]
MTSIESIAARLNLHRAGREWRGSCPACGYNKDAFTLSATRAGRVMGFCASCRDQPAIRAALGAATPPSRTNDPRDDAKPAEARAKAAERALKLWAGSETIRPGDPVHQYLTRRGLAALTSSTVLRYRRDTPHPSGGGSHPAMIALAQDAAGSPVAIHRTYLTFDGRKAVLDPPKASLGPIFGAAIRLSPPGGDLVIGEGIETAASAGLILGKPAWAGVAAGNIRSKLDLPPSVRSIIIAADNDAPGIEAAEAAARRWQGEGRAARIVKPNLPGADFADVLMQREGVKQ